MEEIRIKTYLADGTESGEMVLPLDSVLSLSKIGFFAGLCRKSDECAGTNAIETIKNEIVSQIAECKNEKGEFRSTYAKEKAEKLEKKLLIVCPEMKENARALKTVAKSQLYFATKKDENGLPEISARIGDKMATPDGFTVYIEKVGKYYKATEETSGALVKTGTLKEVKETLLNKAIMQNCKKNLESSKFAEFIKLVADAKSGKIDRKGIHIEANSTVTRDLINMYLTDIYAKQEETTMKENTMNAPVQDAPEQKQPTSFEQKFFDRADRKEARAAKTSAEATAKTEAGWNMLDVIPMGQPVHGSTDRRYREKAGAKIDSGYEMMKKADYQERKAEASREYAEKVQSGAIARSDDPEAIQKLEKRIAELTEQHELSKQAVKKHNAEFDRAVKAGELEERKLDPWGNPLTDDASDWAKRNAYTAYYKNGVRVYKQSVSSSATAEIRRLKKRIEEIRKTAEICKDSDGWEFDGGRIELNAEAGRIQAYFDEIPSDEIRKELKHDGWHWSKTAGAWQKMLNEWNIRRAKQNEILKPIEQPEPEAEAEQPEQMPEESAESEQAEKKEEPAQAETVATEQKQDVEPEKQEEPEQPKTSKGKKNKKKVMTPEEMAEELEKMKHADDWRLSAVLWLSQTNRNSQIIMCEGITAGVITFEEFEEFVTNGYMPKYHTYAEWKKMGRQVKSGEHARFKARIWKYTEKKDTMTAEQAEALNSIILNADGKEYKEGDETFSSKFIKKESFFFGIDQTEKAGEIQRFEIGKSYETKAGIITVTGRTETELTFTAAVNGKSYTKEIQQGKKCEFVKINKAGMTAQATAEIKTAETAPETVPETKPAETVQKPEQTTEKFVAGLVYWDKLQIISRTDKTVTVKNILTGETFRKKINVGKPDKRKPTESEYIKINDYSKLWATSSGCTIKESAERGIASSTKDVERAKKEEYRFHWDGFAKGRYDDAVERLEAYKRILGEQEAA